MFSVKINGILEGFFQGKSGLRQGDPMSPNLFVLAMEVFTRMMNKMAVSSQFKFYPKAKKINLNHIIFADDVLIFCHGDLTSMTSIIETVQQFSLISGKSYC